MNAAPASRPAPDFSEVRYAPLTPSSLLEDDATLRARFQEEGYLYLPGAAPDEGVAQLLEDFLAVLDIDRLVVDEELSNASAGGASQIRRKGND